MDQGSQEERLKHPIPVDRERKHSFIPYPEPTGKISCIRCGRLEEHSIHRVEIKVRA